VTKSINKTKLPKWRFGTVFLAKPPVDGLNGGFKDNKTRAFVVLEVTEDGEMLCVPLSTTNATPKVFGCELDTAVMSPCGPVFRSCVKTAMFSWMRVAFAKTRRAARFEGTEAATLRKLWKESIANSTFAVTCADVLPMR
jgi:hypothetical protein